jgi:hypothetical protein
LMWWAMSVFLSTSLPRLLVSTSASGKNSHKSVP